MKPYLDLLTTRLRLVRLETVWCEMKGAFKCLLMESATALVEVAVDRVMADSPGRFRVTWYVYARGICQVIHMTMPIRFK
jgi:hypothetical protein